MCNDAEIPYIRHRNLQFQNSNSKFKNQVAKQNTRTEILERRTLRRRSWPAWTAISTSERPVDWQSTGREEETLVVGRESGNEDKLKKLLLLFNLLLLLLPKLKVEQQWCWCWCWCWCWWALLMDKRSAREERPEAITRLIWSSPV